MTWIKHHAALLTLCVVTAALAAVVAVLVVGTGPATREVTARFSEAPGLYANNDVEVLGIPVGKVTSVKPGAGYVTVRMRVDKSVKLPANVDAVLMAPEVVSDRFVQLEPAYTSGPVLTAGSTIPVSRTAIPQSVDQVVAALSNLAEQLGPNGANKNGALNSFVKQLSRSLGGSGSNMNSAIRSFNQALQGLSSNPQALAGTLTNLGELSQALSEDTTSYKQLSSSLAQVSQVLSDDRGDVSAAMASLQQMFGDLTTFIDQNGQSLGSSIKNLDTFAAALQSQQKSLAQAYDLAPLALENLDQAIDKSAPGGPAIVGRYDPVGSTEKLFNQVCGNATLRFLVILATGTQTNPLTVSNSTDTLCAMGNALNALTPPPGAANGPDLTLEALNP